MAGIGNKIPYPTDDMKLTFGDLKEILTKAAMGEFKEEIVEKIDGISFSFSYCNELKIARNKTELLRGGLTKEELLSKYQTKPTLYEAFDNCFDTLNSACYAIQEQYKKAIFGLSSNPIFYTCELIYPNAKNVISYDNNAIVLHQRPIYQIVNNEVKKLERLPNFQLLEGNIKKMQSIIAERNWKISGPIMIALQKLNDGNVLKIHFEKLTELMRLSDSFDHTTIENYLIKQLIKNELSSLPISIELKESMAQRLLEIPNSLTMNEIRNLVPTTIYPLWKYIVDNKRAIIDEYKEPLEEIFKSFSAEILSNIQSSFLSDFDRNNQSVQLEIKNTIQKIKEKKDIKGMAVLQKILPRLGDIEKLKLTCEGIIFEYNGKCYKFTGRFGDINRLCGLRYGY